VPAAQSRLKVDIVTEAFARTGKLVVSPRLRTLGEDVRRTTVRMASGTDGIPGFRKSASNDVVAVSRCMVADERVNTIVSGLRFDNEGEATIRVSRTGERGVHVHEGKLLLVEDEGLARGSRGVVHEEVAGHRFRVSMGSFFQASPEAAELLVDVVTRRLNALELGNGGRLVDAYGGVGLFARALADRFDDLVLVESNPQACRDAIVNLSNCAATVVQSEFERWDPCEARVVVADPARRGLGKGGVANVVATDAEVVVLVSCDPVAGARDARMLVDAGYQLGDVEVLDIFPNTHHVEVVSILTREQD
jgi:tRNA/tmRNA/rRNA uracil-C5-methylase (TrmA/RlmC/RlmD family)